MIQLTDANGNVFGLGTLQVTGPDGKPKTISGGSAVWGSITGTLTAQTDLTSYLSTNYYPLSSNPAGYLTGITSTLVTTALGYTPVNKAGDTMTGNLILNTDPTTALGAATKQYVDNIVSGINFHEPVHAATTGNLSATYLNGSSGVGATLTATANGALIVDGHTMLTGERVLVWQQTSGLENGIYDVTDTGSPSTPFILTRSADADNSPTGELAYGDFCFVQQGTLYGGYGFIMNTPGTITIGTTSISYVQFNAAQAITAGYGLQELTPNVISADTSILATVASLGSYLTSAAAALTYYPLTNPAGYIDSSALTPYLTSATAASTYLTITTAASTYYLASNPSGYITSSALTPYLTSATAASTYYPIPTGTTSQYLRGDGSLATFPTIPTVTPSALTKVDDTNVTLTLGGTPSTALLQAVSLTLGWTGTLADARITSASNWNTAYTNRITSLTTTGSSGAATLVSNVLNIPNYTLAGLGGVSTSRTISTTAPLTGGGDLSADRTLSITQATTSTNGYLSSTDWNTFNNKSLLVYDNSTGTQSIPANTVTYITDSQISTASIKAGSVVTWNISVTKTAAGTAAPAWTVKFGTAISTADTTILTFTGAAQTAAVDTGMITIQCIFRTVGSGTSAVLVGHYSLTHQLATTGLSTGGGGAISTSAGFNSTTANAFLGVTVNSGASAVWTINQVFVKLENTL